MPGYRRRFSEPQLEAALRANHGNQSAAAKALEEATGVSVSRQSIHDRVRKSPRLCQVITNAEEAILDLAESKMSQEIEEGDFKAVSVIWRPKESIGAVRACVSQYYLIADPNQMSDLELDRAIEQLEAMTTIDHPRVAARAALADQATTRLGGNWR